MPEREESPVNQIKPKESVLIKANFYAPEITDYEDLTFRIGIEFYNLLEGFQGNKVKVSISDPRTNE